MGRKKIEIKKIECAMKRRMTLNKRSRGLIKKAKELAILCDADVALVIISAGKVQHFSNRPGIEQVVEQFNANIQERSESGMCANKEPCKGSCCESHLLKSGNQSLSEQQIETGQEENEAPVYSDIMDELPSKLELDNFLESDFTPFSSNFQEQIDNGPLSTNPASGMQSAHNHITIEQSEVVEAPQGQELMIVQRDPVVEMGDATSIQISVPGQFISRQVRAPDEASYNIQRPQFRGCEIPFSSGEHQSSSLWCLPGGEAGKLEHFSNKPFLQVSNASTSYDMQCMESTCGYIPMAQPQGRQMQGLKEPIQHMHGENEAGMSSDYFEKLLESYMREAKDEQLVHMQGVQGEPSRMLFLG